MQEQHVRYRALSRAAVISLVCGLASFLTVVNWFFALAPIVGIVSGAMAVRRIRRAPNELTGMSMARAGVWLSVIFWTLGYGVLIFARVKEVPYGYKRITYEMLQPDPNVAGERVPPAVYDLQPTVNQDKKVFITGYISPTRQQVGLKGFILCPALANCPFCNPKLKPTEMIRITLSGDLTTDYTTHLIRLGGRFRVDPNAPGGVPYHIEADYLR